MMIILFYYAIITMLSMYYLRTMYFYIPHTNSWAEVNKPSNRKFTNSMYIDGIEYWRTKLLLLALIESVVLLWMPIWQLVDKKNNNYYYETYFLDNTQWNLILARNLCFLLSRHWRIFYSTEESEYYTLFQPLSSLYYVELCRRDKSKPYGQKILCTKNGCLNLKSGDLFRK